MIDLKAVLLKPSKVSDEEFPIALRKALPLKSAAAIKELVGTFGTPDEVEYEHFFEEDPNGKPSKFVEKLEEQDNQEKAEYIHQIKETFSKICC